MTVLLSDSERDRLMKPVRGQGGWQRLLRKLQRQLSGKVLTLGQDDYRRVQQYRSRYGSGGWQSRLSFFRRVHLDSAA